MQSLQDLLAQLAALLGFAAVAGAGAYAFNVDFRVRVNRAIGKLLFVLVVLALLAGGVVMIAAQIVEYFRQLR